MARRGPLWSLFVRSALNRTLPVWICVSTVSEETVRARYRRIRTVMIFFSTTTSGLATLNIVVMVESMPRTFWK